MTRPRSRWIVILLGLLLSHGARLVAQTRDDCLACHGERTLTRQRKGGSISLMVDRSVLERSRHKDLACVDCHAGFDATSVPHRARIEPVDCSSCHPDVPKTHGFHTLAQREPGTGRRAGATCQGCHGAHDVLAWTGLRAGERASRLVSTCGQCHGPVTESFADSEHGRASAAGVKGAPDCISCHGNPIGKSEAPPDGARRKIAQEKLCLSCHLDDPDVRGRVGPQAGFIAAYETSVHGAALLRGNGAAANCVDCHGSHEMRKGLDPRARMSKQRIPSTCGTCHGGIAREYARSVHGLAVKSGNREAPVCTDCHGEHGILRHTDPRSPVAPANVSAQVCSPCHSSVRLSEKYGLPSGRPQSFADSYHGLALRGGSVEAANCASCHGAHNIRPSSDPASTVNKSNLAVTCGNCHPGANARFAVGAVHVVVTQREEPALYWIATIYVGLIVLTVGIMVVHNLIDFVRKSLRRLHSRRGEIGEEPAGRGLYVRMTLAERIQHGALVLSFTVLVITGFMLRYPESWWVSPLRGLGEGLFDLRSLLHRIAAVILVAGSVVHVGYVSFTVRGRRLVRDLLPGRRDLLDILGALRYNLGLSRLKPAFGRFSYVEKVEYWALVWGTGVMSLTGVILWFENASIGFLSKLGWDIARTIHFYEAWLAALAVLVWHIYQVVFNPDVYPMNMAWLTGTITESEMTEKHPLELEAIRRESVEEERRARAELDRAAAQERESTREREDAAAVARADGADGADEPA